MFIKKTIFYLIAIAGSSALFVKEPSLHKYSKGFDRYSLFSNFEEKNEEEGLRDSSSNKKLKNNTPQNLNN
jgi:hypothetical protein